MDEIDRKIVLATQGGLPLVAKPYEAVGEIVEISSAEVIKRMEAMLENGMIRRIGLVPNHYALGYKFNGMTTWNVPDEKARELGKKIGALDCVTHSYLRPRHLPDWPYNIFAMVHGKDKETAEAGVEQIAEVLGEHNQGHMVLFSTKILKKTGLRLGGKK
ncbi:MAG: Lrp/AsnC family transcriptional regulator [Rhodospirillales bacterium]|nr:Lrp/AsnC family transcriptional regulator [Rhodospirillales bacterium]